MVALPPMLAQKISGRIMGMGLNPRRLASSTVMAARNNITVILSMNMERMADRSMKEMKIGMTL